MAGLQERNGSFRLLFRFRGRQRTLPLGKVTRREADAKAAQVDYLLLRLEQELVSLPPGTDIVDFLKHDGQPAAVGNTPVTRTTLATLRDRFLATHAGAQEKSSLYTAGIHFKHLAATLGEGFPLAELAQADLQGHVDRRGAAGIAPATIRKELSTFRAAWNWGRRSGLVAAAWPGNGLVYRKAEEKPPFQTRAEIERQLEGLAGKPREALWESLYLTLPEIEAFLAEVQGRAAHAWILPLVATAAHAGLRRSELVRARKADVDLEAMVLTVRERKRSKAQRTTRRVPLSTALAEILRRWLAEHPGGPHLFAPAEEIARSKKRSRTTGHQNGERRPTTASGRLEHVSERERPGLLPLTADEVSDHFRRTLAGSAWEVVPGLHTLRHSFLSACAVRGVDQRYIDEWAGHVTEEQRRRYRHLAPDQQRTQIRSVFG